MNAGIKIILGKSSSFLLKCKFAWIMKKNLFLFSAKFSIARSLTTVKAVSRPSKFICNKNQNYIK